MSVALLEPSVAADPAACAHCGLPVPRQSDDQAAGRFCCRGCETAWTVIHDAGLEAYYDTVDRREGPVVASGRGYQEFDHPTFEALYVREVGGERETDLYLEGVHCASCVWLVERVPLVVPGAISAELNVPRSLARVRWDPSRTSLSAIARGLDRLGYPVHPFRGGRAEDRRRLEDRAMVVRIGVAGAIALNVMTVALSLYAGWFGAMEASYVRYFRWISLLLTIPSIFWPGRVFFASAWAAIRTRQLHMDVPIALALGAGFVRGAINTVTDTGPIYFDGVVTLIFLLLVGRFLQLRAQRAAADSAELLHALVPSTATLVEGDELRTVPAESLVPGSIALVRAGDSIPADGTVVAGDTSLDVSLLTGESTPVRTTTGDRVYAGTHNVGSAIRIAVTDVGEASRLGQILRQLEEGMSRRAPVVHTADRLAGWFVGIVLVLASVTWAWWAWRGSDAALDNAIALLVVTCPCALALATPLTMSVAIGRAAKRGILIRGGDALEVLSRPAALFLDKTGTLTEGRLSVAEWWGHPDHRGTIKGLEVHSNHPIARAFEAAWPAVVPSGFDRVEQTLGGGLEGSNARGRFRLGSPAFVLSQARDPERLAGRVAPYRTPVLLAHDGVVVAAAGLGDPLRPDSAAALARLTERGFQVGILSGDAPGVVAAVASQLGIVADRALGGQTPEQKVDRVSQAQSSGPVVMVGDGVNDAPAIGRATVGIGVKGGAEACLAAADVFLAEPGLTPLVTLVDGSRRTLQVIRRNLAVSIGYNLMGAVLAMTGVINPLIAAVMMPVSSITVVLLSWRSRTFEEIR